MITSIHTLIYSDDAKATRAFLRDVLGWKYVAEDWDEDWLIFQSGRSEMGVHPTHSVWEGKTYEHPRHHAISLMCDDLEATVAELRGKGAEFRGPIEEQIYGRIIISWCRGRMTQRIRRGQDSLKAFTRGTARRDADYQAQTVTNSSDNPARFLLPRSARCGVCSGRR